MLAEPATDQHVLGRETVHGYSTYSKSCLSASKLRTIWNASEEWSRKASALSIVNGGVLVISSACDRGKLNARMGAIET